MIKPLGNRVLIKPAQEENRSVGGILLPDSAKEKPCEGVVIAVGPGKTYDNGVFFPTSVKPGDTVVYGKWSGTEFKRNGDNYIVVDEDQIIGIEELDEAEIKEGK